MTHRNLLTKTIVFLFVFLFLFGCQGLKNIFMGPEGAGVYHEVQKGQTLYRIAQVYDIDIDRLKRTNRILDPSRLRVGTRLWIPGARKVLTVPFRDQPNQVAKKSGQRPTVRPKKGVLVWPVQGLLTSRFGKRWGNNHDGIDIGAPKGTPVVAAAAGKVEFSGWGPTGYGKMVIIKHKNHLTTVYAHNSKIWVKKGNRVKQNQRIADVGNTGRSTGPHLHFEVRNDTHPQDPLKYLPRKN